MLDGQQRLRTLSSFYKGLFRGKEFKLESVQERFKGSTFESLGEDDRRRLNDAIIHATVVRQDQPSDDQESVYLIFERLNTGGTNLQPQEIRSALYDGLLAQVIRELNEDENWRAVYGQRSERLKDHELILRFFALFFYADNYERPMKVFLNRYMGSNRDLRRQDDETLRSLFSRTIETVREAKGDKVFRPVKALNAAVFDAVMTGVAHRLTQGPAIQDLEAFAAAYDTLLELEQFRNAVGKSTADEDTVRTRLSLARAAFAGLE